MADCEFWPRLHPGGTPVTLHSKLMIVDDCLLHIGSANISNRSLGADTELDLAIEADPEAWCQRAAILHIRDRLVTEHLGFPDETVTTKRAETRSLVSTIDALQGISSRGLEAIYDAPPGPAKRAVGALHPFDPESVEESGFPAEAPCGLLCWALLFWQESA